MKSGLRRLLARNGPPVSLAGQSRAGIRFNLVGNTSDRDTFLRTYSQSGTVFAIVSLLAQSAASPEWHLYRKPARDGRVRYTTGDRGSDQRAEVVQHAALQLLQSPNNFHTRFEFFEGANQHLELTGETFWVVGREGASFPTSLWYVSPSRLEPVPHPDDYLVGWIYTAPTGEQVPLKLDEVIQEKIPDPMDPFRGAGPVASIMPNIQQQRYATEYQRNVFIAGAQPGGVIQVPSRLTEEQFDELTDRWREAHQGVARAGRVGVLEAGMTWVPHSATTNRDMEYGALRLANRDELREAWRMHKSMLGTVEDVNRANAQTAEEVFYSQHVISRLNRRRDTLNNKLLPMFGTTGLGVEFDYEDPSPGNREADNEELTAKATAAQILVAAGFDPEAVLETVGLPAMPTLTVKAPQESNAAQAPSEATAVPMGRESLVIQAKGDPRGRVFEQLAKDFPPQATAWVHDADWSGPLRVPLDHINPTMDGMEGADPEHVREFVQRLKDGKKLNPVVLVKLPGKDKLRLVDGHHRFLAYAELGLPVKAFVGKVNADHGPWDDMHDSQLPKTGDRIDSQALSALFSQPFVARVGASLNVVSDDG